MKRTAIISFALLMVFAATSASAQYQPKTKPIAEQWDFFKNPEKEHIRNDSLRRIDTVEALPKALRDYLGDMANPREPWQESRTFFGPELPFRRLVFAAASDDHFIVYYELADRAYFGGFRFDIFSFKQKFPLDARSFDFGPDCLGHECEVTATVARLENLIHRGSGYTGRKLQTVEELKAAILEDGLNQSHEWETERSGPPDW